MTPDRFELWQGLPEPALAILAQDRIEKRFKRGERLYHAGGSPAGIYLIRSGLVGLVAVSSSGNEHLLRLFKPGQTSGHRALFADEPYHADAIAIEETLTWYLPSETVFRLVDGFPVVARRMLAGLSKELRRAELLRVSISDKDVVSRVAEALLFLKDVYPDHQWTRKEIADFCGSTAPTVIRTLARFEEQGLIRQTGRRIDVLNRDGLLDISGTI